MYNDVVKKPVHSTEASTDMLWHTQLQVEALLSQHSSLSIHRQAIERQLASIAAHIHEPAATLTPRSIFPLLEMRGSGGVSRQLEQIARIVHEQGYWKPAGRVENYHRQDVYALGRSTQKLFDDAAKLDRRVEQLHIWLRHIGLHFHVDSEMSIRQVFQCLAATLATAETRREINRLVTLLNPDTRYSWIRRLFGRR